MDRRKFLKYGFIGASALVATMVPYKLDMKESFTAESNYAPKFKGNEAKAYCMCGTGSCSGGGSGYCICGTGSCGGSGNR